MRLTLTGALDTVKIGQFRTDTCVRYETRYKETSRDVATLEDGTIQVTEIVTHQSATIYDASGNITTDNITVDIENSVKGIKHEAPYTFPIGKFDGNKFTADKESSLRAVAHVELKANNNVSGNVDIVVGMDPYMLMDFEDKIDSMGKKTSAEEYWDVVLGNSVDNKTHQYLSPNEVRQYGLWVRSGAGNAKLQWTDELKALNGIISSEENSNVLFGNYAYKLAWDHTTSTITKADNVATDMGLSADLLLDSVKPTKIGMWIYVPKECSTDDSQLKAIFGGAAAESANNSSYLKMGENGEYILKDGYTLGGVTGYVQYYSYDAEGNITGEKLSDWAGKGWVWVEADMSAFQMPISVYRAYTVRVSSPQNCTKEKHYILIDNVQFIYGTNPNDINKPVIESVTEKSTGVNLKTAGERPIFANKVVTFEVPLTDNKQTDKYASGIDGSSIKVYVDGRDYTTAGDLFSISETEYGTNIVFQTPELTNGQHSVKIRVKDYYGNETIETYSYIIDDEAGKPAAVTVQKQDGDATPGGTIALDIVNNGESAASTVEVMFEVSEAYANVFKS